jgi:hypothetical protein
MNDNVTPFPGAPQTETNASAPIEINLPEVVERVLDEQQGRLFNARAMLWCLEQVVRELASEDLAPVAMREEPLLRIASAIAAVKDVVEQIGIDMDDDEIEERAERMLKAEAISAG